MSTRTWCVSDVPDLARWGPPLAELQERTGCPVTARWTWQRTWLQTSMPTDSRVMLVLVERVSEGESALTAAAPLVARRRGRGWLVVPIGDGPSDRVQLPCEGTYEQLAMGVRDALAALGDPWRLRVQHLDPCDPVAAALQDALPHAAVVHGDVSPTTRFGTDRDVRAYVSRNAHQQVRRMRNRVAREGHLLELATLRSRAEVSEVLPDLERVHRARDLQVGRPSAVDDPEQGAFLRELLPALASEGAVELTVLRLDGRLAAYVLCWVDPGARRMWNCRFDPEWERFAPGRLALHAALQTALTDPECHELDWMRGTEAYKSQLSNSEWRAVDLHACSSTGGWLLRRANLRASTTVRRLRDEHDWVARGVEALRPLVERLR